MAPGDRTVIERWLEDRWWWARFIPWAVGIVVTVWGIIVFASEHPGLRTGWGLVLVLVGVLVIVITEMVRTKMRHSRGIGITPSPKLSLADSTLELRQLLAEANVMNARLGTPAPLVSVPKDLRARFTTWIQEVDARLAPWPVFREHFRSGAPRGMASMMNDSMYDDLPYRKNTLDEIIRQIDSNQ